MDDSQRRNTEIRKSESALGEILLKISHAVSTTRNLDDLFQTIHAILKNIVDAANFFIGLIDEPGDRLFFPYFQDERHEYFEIRNISNPQTRNLSVDVIRQEQPVFLTKDKIIENGTAVLGEPPLVWIGIPLKIKEKVIGLMAVQEYENPDRYQMSDIDMLVSVSRHVAIAIERKMTEEALLDSERKHRNIIESIEEGYYEIDLGYVLSFFNDALCEMTGRTQPELMGTDIRTTISQRDIPVLVRAIEDVLDGGKAAKCIGCEIIRKDGTSLYSDISVSLMADMNGEPEGFRGIFRDITEKKKIEAELVRTRNFLQNIFDSTVDSIITTDLNGKVTFISSRARAMLNMSDDDIIGEKVYKIYDKGYEEASFIMKTLMSEGELKNHEMKTVTKDNEILDIHLSASLLKNEIGIIIGTLGIFRDISDKKRLEEQLQQTQKMKAVATLAGGIAHNFNNILMAIQGYTSLMLFEMDISHPYRKMLENIEKQIENGAKLTSRLIEYARERKYTAGPIDLNQLIKETIFTFASAKKEIRINLNLDQSLLYLQANKGQIEQLLMNMFVNAIEAMPEGGELCIETQNITGKEASALKKERLLKLDRDHYILLTIRDTGVGIDPEVIDQIFEPFYTTKSMGKGTGLGLSSVYGIVQSCGGMINVESRKGVETTFSIVFPAVEETPQAISVDPKHRDVRPGTVLMVDDEGMILDVGGKMLRTMGYHVLTASGGREAVELYKKHRSDIDFVILDMIMPGMSGGDTYKALMEIDKKTRVILTSGYDAEDKASSILSQGKAAFIQKPFNLKALSDKIEEILTMYED